MRRKFKQRLIALVLFMTFIAVTYICVNNLDDPNRLYWKKSEKKSTDYDSNFTPFCDRNKPDWLRMIRSALKTLDYFEDHLDELVTDAAVGTRIMEAQLNILLKSGPNLSPEILRDLKELHRKSKLVGDTIVERYMEYIELNGVEQNARMKKNLNWIISSSTWETPSPKQWKTLITNNGRIDTADGIDMNVTFGSSSDGCIFGTFENCEIPNYCIDFMWRKPLSGYLLTHQILFHYMIGRNDCFSGKRRILYESQNLVQPKSFLETMCRRVITETKLIESRHYPYTHQDLFVEQILVCSLAGYNDFLTSKWTNVLLEWSAENELLGCYTTIGVKKMEKIGSKKRVKRWDSIIHVNDKLCSVHMGALILGVVGQQLRYFLEMCYDL